MSCPPIPYNPLLLILVVLLIPPMIYLDATHHRIGKNSADASSPPPAPGAGR